MGKIKLPKNFPKNREQAIKEIEVTYKYAMDKKLEVKFIFVGPEIWSLLGGDPGKGDGLFLTVLGAKFPVLRDDTIFGPALAG
jgi:hypothetical protein